MDQNDKILDVKFDTDTETSTNTWQAVKYYSETATPKIIKWVTKYSGGSIKTERQAEYLLFIFVVVAMAVSFYLFFGNPLSFNKKIVPPILSPGIINPNLQP